MSTDTTTVDATTVDTGAQADTTTDTDTTDTATATGPAGDAQAELAALRAKLKKANAEAAAHRKQADELKRKGETESEAAVRTAREEAAAAAEKTWKPRFVRSAARSALVEAGLIGKPDRLLKLIDADAVEIDEDGEVTGLDAQVRDLKRDYPELFGKRGAGRIDGADRGSSGADTTGGLSRATQLLLQQAGRA